MKESARFFEALAGLYQELRFKVREKWKRDMPFEELLFDRWERAKSLGFGEGASIYHNSYVYGDVKVGKNSWIGPFTILDGSGGLEIGSYCSVSAGVHIYTHDSVKWALSSGKAQYEHAPVRVGDCCHIGAQAVIVKGVNIGEHCVIGAGAFVNCHIPSFTIAVGQPCRIIGKVHVSASGEVTLNYSS